MLLFIIENLSKDEMKDCVLICAREVQCGDFVVQLPQISYSHCLNRATC